jgi:hypothetical protein
MLMHFSHPKEKNGVFLWVATHKNTPVNRFEGMHC